MSCYLIFKYIIRMQIKIMTKYFLKFLLVNFFFLCLVFCTKTKDQIEKTEEIYNFLNVGKSCESTELGIRECTWFVTEKHQFPFLDKEKLILFVTDSQKNIAIDVLQQFSLNIYIWEENSWHLIASDYFDADNLVEIPENFSKETILTNLNNDADFESTLREKKRSIIYFGKSIVQVIKSLENPNVLLNIFPEEHQELYQNFYIYPNFWTMDLIDYMKPFTQIKVELSDQSVNHQPMKPYFVTYHFYLSDQAMNNEVKY